MVRHYKMPKKYFKSRKYKGKCEKCGCKCDNPKSYVDESNCAITYNAPYLCDECYRKMYGNQR